MLGDVLKSGPKVVLKVSSMSELYYSIERDLREACAMADALADYVRNDQLYGTVRGGLFGSGSMPSLTPGALAMRLRRLQAVRLRLDDRQQEQLETARARQESVMSEWRMHYEKKLLHELGSRLDAMRTFFQECEESQRLCASAYRPEALRRTIAQEVLLQMERLHIRPDQEMQRKIRDTDGRLRGFVQPTDFLWAAPLQPVYEKAVFWWLYHAPPYPDERI